MTDFKKLLDTYCKNMERQNELDASLLTEADRDDWIALLQKRSMEYEEINLENNGIIQSVNELLAEPMDEIKAKEYYNAIREMYEGAYDEFEILIPTLQRILKSVQDENSVALFNAYSLLYFERDVIRANALGLSSDNTEYLEKAIALFDNYPFWNEKYRTNYWNNYFNYIIACLDIEQPNPDLSYQRLQEMLRAWESPVAQDIDGQNETICNTIDGIKQEWLGVAEYIDYASDETKQYFCELSDFYFERECKGIEEPIDYQNEIYAAHLVANEIRGIQSLDEILLEYFDYYEKRCKVCSGENNNELDKFYFLTNTPMTIERWCRRLEDRELKAKILRVLKNNTKKTWYNLSLGMDSVMNSMLRKWCFTMVSHLNSTSEKIDWIIELVVRRQITTYLHSAMVRNLGEAIGREIMRVNPEYYDTLPEDAKENPIEFIKTSALLHDIGKTSITNVIKTQGRKLSDDEFSAIMRHPESGYNMLDEDEALQCYADVAIAHHKFYDGTGGYPKNYDNLASPYKAITDIITICDCLDAATDYLGRNYKRAKTFDDVMEEFRRDKGTRYCPFIVDLIDESPRLRNELRYIVGEGRVDTMYKAYLQNAI